MIKEFIESQLQKRLDKKKRDVQKLRWQSAQLEDQLRKLKAEGGESDDHIE